MLRPCRRLTPGRALAVACALASVLVLAACGSSTKSSSGAASTAAASAKPKPGTLQLWLGGILTTSTPGSPFRTWVDEQVTRFKAANPGSDVKITLLPADNDQLAAKVQSAFAANKVPDVMMLYSGAYTTAYQERLQTLNAKVDSTPGFYDSMSNWDLSCGGFDCQGAKGKIYGVPSDNGGFFLFYNKSLFKKAGIADPPATFTELLSACTALKAKGILPMAYGDRDGYTTVNWLDEDLASYLGGADVQGIATGKVRYDDPRVVQSLGKIAKLRTAGCVQDDAATHEQIDATKAFSTGKAAMVEMYPALLSDFKKGLGSKLGVARLPISGNGPAKDKIAANSLDNWVVPQGSAHPDLAWAFIKMVSDPQAGQGIADQLALIPANKDAAAKVTDPYLKFIGQQVADPSMPLLDSIVPNNVALFLYKQLNLAFAGKTTPAAALKATQQTADQQGP
jgi:ABC-type glycerol-3-phosphate transport system substrate-binding protein